MHRIREGQAAFTAGRADTSPPTTAGVASKGRGNQQLSNAMPQMPQISSTSREESQAVCLNAWSTKGWANVTGATAAAAAVKAASGSCRLPTARNH